MSCLRDRHSRQYAQDQHNDLVLPVYSLPRLQRQLLHPCFVLITTLNIVLTVSPSAIWAADSTVSAPAPKASIAVGPDRKVKMYRLESVELRGSTRMTSSQVQAELGLKIGMPLDDDLVMTTRTRLLGLGLFKSAILLMRKGSQSGQARLIIEVEDDGGVLSDWALGGELGVTVNENGASSVSEQAPMDYRIGIVGRNVLRDLHRGSLYVDVDSEGVFRGGQIAYGLPRFAAEDMQFDAEIAAVDVSHRFLDGLGFGGRGQGLWSRPLAHFGEIQYGAAMYVNRKQRFAVPGFPAHIAGPKIAYSQETRLRGFYPGAGHLLSASLLLAPTETDNSVIELSLGKTWDLASYAYLTFDTQALAVGTKGYALRGESRIDIPLGGRDPEEDQAELFLRLRGGHDIFDDDINLIGSAAIIGLRYHSSGFIAELALKIVRSPEELAPKKIGFDHAGAPQ